MIKKLKVCGMKNDANILEIASLQPDYLGFIFWEKSSRVIEINQLPQLPDTIKKVGVFVNAYYNEIIAKVEHFSLDIVQLHGTESPTLCRDLQNYGIKVCKAFSINDITDFSNINLYIPYVDYVLFDTKGSLPGGNGTQFNWKLLENYHFDKPFFLSGGIGPNHIDQLKEFFNTEVSKKCFAIDVNSQFESEPGIKNRNNLKEFQQQLNTF